MIAALSKLKFLVVVDPLQTETARFWENHGEFNQAEPADIQTEVFELPSTCFAEDEGAPVNSSRWLQWHWAGQEPPFQARTDIDIMADLHIRLKAMYKAEGARSPIRSSISPGLIASPRSRRRKNSPRR
jgi:formate dehydrogenase major subunit